MTLILGIETPSHESAVARLRGMYPDADVIVCSYTYPDATPVVLARNWVPGGLETIDSIKCGVRE